MTALPIHQPDVTLRLDEHGIIRAASVAGTLATEGVDMLVGKAWSETVADVGTDKVRSMVADARERRVSGFRQVTQCFPSGRRMLIEYTTVQLGDRDGLLAIGRNLQAVAEVQSRLISAQQEIEREYWKLREVETRYRLLFDNSNEAVLLVRAADLRITEANPAAARALGLAGQASLAPTEFDVLSALPPDERARFQGLLMRVKEDGTAPAAFVHLGESRKPWLIRASLTTTDEGNLYMLQLIPVGSAQPGINSGVSFESLLEHLPGGYVVLDPSGHIIWANRGFLDLVQVDAREWVQNQPLGRWLTSRETQIADLVAAARREHGISRFFAEVTSEQGRAATVQASAVANDDDCLGYVGLLLHPAAPPGEEESEELIRACARLAPADALRPLPERIRTTAESFERECLAHALERALGDQARAAELLGISPRTLRARLRYFQFAGDPPPNGKQAH